ncbi:hypothetical protein OH492_05040 [Vibrio chagasii]|nr:hypothetical protein [Vibrio chagasii]
MMAHLNPDVAKDKYPRNVCLPNLQADDPVRSWDEGYVPDTHWLQAQSVAVRRR